MKTRIFIADSQPLLRLGIRSCLNKQTEFEIVGEADTRDKLVEQILVLNPDILLIDIATLGRKPYDLVQNIRQQKVPIKIVVLTAKADKRSVIGALCAGVDGYVLKDEDLESIPLAIQSIMKGKQWISPSISHFLIERIRRPDPAQSANLFSDQDMEILRHVAEGLSNSEISCLIGRAERTVEHHLTTIFRLLEIHSRTEAAVWAREHNMI